VFAFAKTHSVVSNDVFIIFIVFELILSCSCKLKFMIVTAHCSLYVFIHLKCTFTTRWWRLLSTIYTQWICLEHRNSENSILVSSVVCGQLLMTCSILYSWVHPTGKRCVQQHVFCFVKWLLDTPMYSNNVVHSFLNMLHHVLRAYGTVIFEHETSAAPSRRRLLNALSLSWQVTNCQQFKDVTPECIVIIMASDQLPRIQRCYLQCHHILSPHTMQWQNNHYLNVDILSNKLWSMQNKHIQFIIKIKMKSAIPRLFENKSAC
jgi:hypothetical protein